VVLKHEIQPLTKATFMHQLILNLVRVITSRVSATLPSLVKIVSAVVPPRGGEIYESRAFIIIIIIIFVLYSLTGKQPIP